ERHVKSISCGSNFSSSICIHKWVSGADQSVCSGCRQAFGFTRKRHNCYNCGLVHCHACSSKKALKAALAPTPGKPHRVCDACYTKLKAGDYVYNSSVANRNASTPTRSLDGLVRPDRETRSSRILLSPKTEPVKYSEVRSSRSESSIVRASQVPALQQLKDVAFPSSLSAIQNAFRPSSSLSSSTRTSRRQTVRSPKQKCDHQGTKIQRLKKTAREVSELAVKHSSKHKAATEVMKSVAEHVSYLLIIWIIKHSQKITEAYLNASEASKTSLPTTLGMVQQDTTLSANTQEQKLELQSSSSGATTMSQEPSNITDATSHPSDSRPPTEASSPPSKSGGKEIIEQFEPGVYVTYVLHKNGGKIFRRVRFSKRRFDEHQAEEWWNSEKVRLLKRYSHHVLSSSPRASDSVPTLAPILPPASSPTQPHSGEAEDSKSSS
ncbi:unnamed protein product, partial [Thlaspi arvense]